MATGGKQEGRGQATRFHRRAASRVPVIVERLNDEPALALRAASNPLLVLQEMVIELTDRLAAEVELRLRFCPEQVERLPQLRSDLQKRAGERLVWMIP